MFSDFERTVQENLGPYSGGTTGFLENLPVGFENEQREYLPIRSAQAMDSAADQQVEAMVLRFVEDGSLTNEEVNVHMGLYGKLDTEGILNYLNHEGYETGVDVDEFLTQRAAHYDVLRADDESVLSRQDLGGWMGEMVGRVGATFTDEAYLATLPLGIGTTNTIFSAAVRTAGLNGVLQLGAEPFIYDFQQKTGGKYGRVDQLLNIGGATLFGGAAGAAGKAMQQFLTTGEFRMFNSALKDMDGITPTHIKNMATKSKEMQGKPDIVTAAETDAQVTPTWQEEGKAFIEARQADMKKAEADAKAAKAKGKPDVLKREEPGATGDIPQFNDALDGVVAKANTASEGVTALSPGGPCS